MKDKGKVKYINNVVDYIEKNLSSDINANVLMRFGFISHSQLYRDFYNLTGHPVKEYIRKRRLSNALALIKKSDYSLADIAYRCGYSSQQAFCRSVNRSIGMKPLEYKKNGYYYFFPPFQGSSLNDVSVANLSIPETLCIWYYQSRPDHIENEAVSYFYDLIPDYSGRLFGRNGKLSGNKYCYELNISDFQEYIQILTKSRFIIAGKRDTYTSLFVGSCVKNTEEQISNAWNYLYSAWLADSMFECTNEDYFEEYIIKNRKPVKLRLYLPVQERPVHPNIYIEENPNMNFLVSTSCGLNAEMKASRTVLDYISEHSPGILKFINDFFVKKDFNSFTCGIKLYDTINLSDHILVRLYSCHNGAYLVLSEGVQGDYDKYEALIKTFAENNGLSIDTSSIFAVYHTDEVHKNPIMKMYCPVIYGTK